MDSYQRDGLTFPVRDGGPPDGPAVVLLHGFPQDASAFDAVLPPLQARELRTLVPTMRGYARTARPQGRRSYATTETTADLIALLDAAGVAQAHLVAHDWGAAPAWAAAAWRPDRVASLTVLSTPHPAAMAAAMVRSTQAFRSWYMAFFQLPALPDRLVPRTLRKALAGSGLPPAYVERYCATMAEPGAVQGALGWYRGVPFSAKPIGPVSVPTTYVWGREDFALKRTAAQRTAYHVRAPYRFVEVDGGHWLPETRPHAVAAAVLERIGSVRAIARV